MTELKPYFKYKDSSLGKIPEKWMVVSIKRVLATKITDGPHETPSLREEGIPFISAEAIKNGKIDFDLMRGYISREIHNIYKKKCLPQKHDIFIVKSGATTGNVAMVEMEKEFNIWSPLALVRANSQKVLPKYLYFQISSLVFREQVETRWNYGTQQNIGMNILENLLITLPDLKEQKKIRERSEEHTSELQSRGHLVCRLLLEKKKQLKTEKNKHH